MRSECKKVQFIGQHLYVGIDVARKSWKVCIYLGQSYEKQFSQPPEPKALVEYWHRNFPGVLYHSVYEAGYFGFWIHRELTRVGVDSMVINPADVPTTDKERHTKTDRVDAIKLARVLASGVYFYRMQVRLRTPPLGATPRAELGISCRRASWFYSLGSRGLDEQRDRGCLLLGPFFFAAGDGLTWGFSGSEGVKWGWKRGRKGVKRTFASGETKGEGQTECTTTS